MCSTLQAQSSVTLPAGVTGVALGKAQRYQDASGKEMCAIVERLSDPPVFKRGVTEISYGVQLQPGGVKSASALAIAPPGQELSGLPCNIFAPVKGGFSQTQLGHTVSRVDKAPLLPGVYTLRISADGQTANVTFKIE
jgi:hypothetical protein